MHTEVSASVCFRMSRQEKLKRKEDISYLFGTSFILCQVSRQDKLKRKEMLNSAAAELALRQAGDGMVLLMGAASDSQAMVDALAVRSTHLSWYTV